MGNLPIRVETARVINSTGMSWNFRYSAKALETLPNVERLHSYSQPWLVASNLYDSGVSYKKFFLSNGMKAVGLGYGAYYRLLSCYSFSQFRVW